MNKRHFASARRAAAGCSQALLALAFLLVIAAAIHGWISRQPQGVRYEPRGLAQEDVQTIPLQTSGEVAVNTADLDTLMKLRGVGAAYAQAILEEREINGLFYYPEDVMAAKGIGEKRLAAMIDQLDLSAAEDADPEPDGQAE